MLNTFCRGGRCLIRACRRKAPPPPPCRRRRRCWRHMYTVLGTLGTYTYYTTTSGERPTTRRGRGRRGGRGAVTAKCIAYTDSYHDLKLYRMVFTDTPSNAMLLQLDYYSNTIHIFSAPIQFWKNSRNT